VQAHEAKAIVGLMQVYWPSQKLPESTVMLWSKALESYSYEHAKAAVDMLVTSAKWTPSLAEVVATIRGGWAQPGQPELGEGDGPTLEEFMQANPEWRERVEAFTKKATGRREEKSSPPQDRFDKLRKDAAVLDKPKSSHPRGKKACTEHRFITSDRCFYCGSPQEVRA
jgi:hypothetical protein